MISYRTAVRTKSMLQMQKKRTYTDEQKSNFEKMARDCIPTIFALCFTGMYSVVDGLFIGHAVGDDGLAAVNLAWPIPAVITALGIGIGIGGSVLYSRCMGSKEEEEASAIFHVTITSLFLLGR